VRDNHYESYYQIQVEVTVDPTGDIFDLGGIYDPEPDYFVYLYSTFAAINDLTTKNPY
jgi:hypothetical protein